MVSAQAILTVYVSAGVEVKKGLLVECTRHCTVLTCLWICRVFEQRRGHCASRNRAAGNSYPHAVDSERTVCAGTGKAG